MHTLRSCTLFKILHPIWVGAANGDSKESARVLWANLASRCGLKFHPEINDYYFRLAISDREFVKNLRGPEEGNLDDATCQAILESVRHARGSEHCWFYYSGIRPPFETRLYGGSLDEVLLCSSLDGIRTLPEYWWPADRTWCVSTDHDLRFTLIGGSKELVQACIEHPFLECLPVEGSTRVDDFAEAPNFRICVRQLAEQILNGSVTLSRGAQMMMTLQSIGSEESNPFLSVFYEISIVTPAIPLGADRQLWASELLAKKDAELRQIESRYRAAALSACREIVTTF